MKHHILQGAGLALRPARLAPLSKRAPDNLQFLELTPPDWIGLDGPGQLLDLLREGAEVMAQLKREGVVLGARH